MQPFRSMVPMTVVPDVPGLTILTMPVRSMVANGTRASSIGCVSTVEEGSGATRGAINVFASEDSSSNAALPVFCTEDASAPIVAPSSNPLPAMMPVPSTNSIAAGINSGKNVSRNRSSSDSDIHWRRNQRRVPLRNPLSSSSGISRYTVGCFGGSGCNLVRCGYCRMVRGGSLGGFGMTCQTLRYPRGAGYGRRGESSTVFQSSTFEVSRKGVTLTILQTLCGVRSGTCSTTRRTTGCGGLANSTMIEHDDTLIATTISLWERALHASPLGWGSGYERTANHHSMYAKTKKCQDFLHICKAITLIATDVAVSPLVVIRPLQSPKTRLHCVSVGRGGPVSLLGISFVIAVSPCRLKTSPPAPLFQSGAGTPPS